MTPGEPKGKRSRAQHSDRRSHLGSTGDSIPGTRAGINEGASNWRSGEVMKARGTGREGQGPEGCNQRGDLFTRGTGSGRASGQKGGRTKGCAP